MQRTAASGNYRGLSGLQLQIERYWYFQAFGAETRHKSVKISRQDYTSGLDNLQSRSKIPPIPAKTCPSARAIRIYDLQADPLSPKRKREAALQASARADCEPR